MTDTCRMLEVPWDIPQAVGPTPCPGPYFHSSRMFSHSCQAPRKSSLARDLKGGGADKSLTMSAVGAPDRPPPPDVTFSKTSAHCMRMRQIPELTILPSLPGPLWALPGPTGGSLRSFAMHVFTILPAPPWAPQGRPLRSLATYFFTTLPGPPGPPPGPLATIIRYTLLTLA